MRITVRIRGKATRLVHRAGMNKTEAEYARLLEARLKAGQIHSWGFERVTFKIADDTRYTPDFLVVLIDGTVEFHEVKGWWRDDAKVKVKVFATMFPFVVRTARLTERGWQVEEVPVS